MAGLLERRNPMMRCPWALAHAPPPPHAHPLWLTLATVSCTLTLASCGSPGKHHAHASASDAQAVRYSDCMRSHGVANFPDPSPGGGFNLRALGAEAGSPTFMAAQSACAKTQPGRTGRPAPYTGGQKRQMLAKARCIRAHGVPDLPDPTAVSDGIFGEPNLPPGWNPDAPTVLKATSACARVGIPIPSPDGAVG